MIEREISCKAAGMSLLCACAVVFIHTGYLTTPANRLFHDFFHGTGIFAFAVPYFFLASGYFIATEMSGWWLQCLRKRVVSLLIPYMLWNFVAWAFMEGLIAAANYYGHSPHAVVSVPFDAIRIFGLDVVHTPFLAPLWYIRGLMILIFVSPVIFACIRQGQLIVMSFLVVIYVGSCVMTISNFVLHDLLYKGLPVEGLFYFSFGMLLRRNERIPVIPCSIGGTLILGGFGIFAVRSFVEVPELREALRCCGIPLILFGLWSVLPDREEFHVFVHCHFPFISCTQLSWLFLRGFWICAACVKWSMSQFQDGLGWAWWQSLLRVAWRSLSIGFHLLAVLHLE